MPFSLPTKGKFTGLRMQLVGLGEVQLTLLLSKNAETQLYRTDHPGVVVKMFDLACGKADEVSYGPYMDFSHELANFEDIHRIEGLSPFIPVYYGAHIDYAAKFAFIAMEYLEGQDLKSWCEEAAAAAYESGWIDDFREAVFEALSIMRLFHQHGIILIDFKPENIIRLSDRRIRFVDLGALFTFRHAHETQKYIYSATPDHAEVLIDASNVEAGVPPTAASDIFSAGVALFEMATGVSRLVIEEQTADDILLNPAILRFRDSQIRDVCHSYPHLKDSLPLLETQLRERRILFADLWPLLKGWVANKVADWESLLPEQQDQIILATGTTFVQEQLPPELQWLAGPIAQATALRSMRLKTVAELMDLMGKPVPEQVLDDLKRHNCFLQFLGDLEHSIEFVDHLNAWEVRLHPQTEHWAIAVAVACAQSSDSAQFTYLKQAGSDEQGHRHFHIVADLEADDFEGGKLTLWHLKNDRFAWLGCSKADA
ncbi:MAG: hypothetical protein AAB466_00620 [Verrucomicrobiota bacterium]